jgi:LPXTG-site transpeptidase (sortase) family protein
LTGFAPSRITSLPQQPAELTYTSMSDIWLEIPSLNVKTNVVGVPKADNNWDVTWLGRDAGWLNGTAFPSWEGNSVVTAHVTDANGKPGPFANIKDMKYGDKIIVHMYGEKYIFEVQAARMVKPSSTQYAFKHLEDFAYLTLITCQGYDPSSESYLYRRIVRAVLVDVQSE